MARLNRQIIPHSPNHLITRGNNRRRLFSYPRDYRLFIWHVGRAAQEAIAKLSAGPYQRRLRRPNGSRASETLPRPWPFPRRS